MIKGRLDRLHLGDLMQWITMGSLSGRLSLRDRADERRLDFLDGRVVYASSTAPAERLATWLAVAELLTPADARRHLCRSLLERRLFTDVLMDEGVPREAVHRLLRQLAATITSHSLGFEQLEFRFDDAYPVKDLLNISLDVEPQSLLMEAARRADEELDVPEDRISDVLPFEGEAFEELFWNLVRAGVPDSEPLSGDALHHLHSTIRQVVETLSHWLESSPGLVPIPEQQADDIVAELGGSEPVHLNNRPHSVWNQMVFASSVHGPMVSIPGNLTALEEAAAQLGLWKEMVRGDSWRRPNMDRLDHLTGDAVRRWSAAAAAAAGALGSDPEEACLATHLVAVPTDIVLWVLSSLQVRHRGLRGALLDHLPRRLGAGLTLRAVFPAFVTKLFTDREPSALGAAMLIARDTLPGTSAWLATGPEDPADLVRYFPNEHLTEAAEAAQIASL